IGDGTNISELDNTIDIPKDMITNSDLTSLIKTTYHDIDIKNTSTDQYLKNRIILSSRNVDVVNINLAILDIFPEKEKTYLSSDNIITEESDSNTNFYPNEFLNFLKPNGLPPSKLKLKIGYPIILLRNLAPHQSLCNGSQLIITRLNDHLIEAHILTGDYAGNSTFIPCISLISSASELPFKLKQRQFPIQLAFAITINKSQ
ncbi:11509_t:CDS:1, partial [Ambispora leptoticha]